MDVSELTSTQIIIGAAAALAFVGYVVFILVPSWASYGRLWEKLAATFLSLYMLAALLGVGVAAGLLIVWSSDSF
jgi:hypothetical protein